MAPKSRDLEIAKGCRLIMSRWFLTLNRAFLVLRARCCATRHCRRFVSEKHGNLSCSFGASPRGVIALERNFTGHIRRPSPAALSLSGPLADPSTPTCLLWHHSHHRRIPPAPCVLSSRGPMWPWGSVHLRPMAYSDGTCHTETTGPTY